MDLSTGTGLVEPADKNVEYYIEGIVTKLKLPSEIAYIAEQLYRNTLLIEVPDFSKVAVAMAKTELVFPLSEDIEASWPNEAVAGGLVYITCRKQGIILLLVDFEDATSQSLDILTRVYFQLSRVIQYYEGLIDPSLVFGAYAARLDLGDLGYSVARTGLRILQRLNRRKWFAIKGKRPSGLMGAVILLSARLHGFVRSQELILKLFAETDLKMRDYIYSSLESLVSSSQRFILPGLQASVGHPVSGRSKASDIEKDYDTAAQQTRTDMDMEIVSALSGNELIGAARAVLLHRLNLRQQSSVASELAAGRQAAIQELLSQFAPLLEDKPWKWVNSDELMDVEDEEVRTAILTDAERAVKERIWNEIYKDVHIPTKTPRSRNRGRSGRAVLQNDEPEADAAKAVAAQYAQSNPSEKLNYKALAQLFQVPGKEPAGPATTGRKGRGRVKASQTVGMGSGLDVSIDRLGVSLGDVPRQRVVRPQLPGRSKRKEDESEERQKRLKFM